MMGDFNEQELVRSVLSKERAAFERLIRQYEGLVIHIVASLVKNEIDRQDVCQDVFLKVYEKLHTFQFRSKLSTWIGNIAYNTSVNFLKKKRPFLLEDIFKPGMDDNLEIVEKTETLTPERLLIKKDEGQLLKYAVDKLPGIQKTMVLLFHQDEMSLEEISMVVELPVNTVKSHLFRARKNLKEILVQHQIQQS